MSMYLKYSTLIQKQVPQNISLLTVSITFLMLMFQISTVSLMLKLKTLGFDTSAKKIKLF
jgi:hypothetical protein